MVVKAIAHLLSPGGIGARLSILIFHRVLAHPDPLFPGEPDVRRFNEVLTWVGRWFHVLPMDLAVARLAAGTLPARAAAITFDDGYADNITNALPILQRHGMTATFFVATSFLDGGCMWNDSVIEAVRSFRGKVLDLRDAGLDVYPVELNVQRRATIETLLSRIKYLPPILRADTVAFVREATGASARQDLMMTSLQVVQMHQSGMQIGAHTCSHPILASLADHDALGEIRGSKEALDSLLDEPVQMFAYPNGKPGTDYLPKHVEMVRHAGFSAAVSTAPGVSATGADLFQLPRFSPWDAGRLRYGIRLLVNMRMVQPQVA